MGAHVQHINLDSNKEILDAINNPKQSIFNTIKANSYLSSVASNMGSSGVQSANTKLILGILSIDPTNSVISEVDDDQTGISKSKFIIRHSWETNTVYNLDGFLDHNKSYSCPTFAALVMNSNNVHIAKIA